MSEYISKITFSDDCIFHLKGSVNTQNVIIWGTERLVEGRQTFSHSPSIMVWLGISKEKAIGAYFFQDQNLNGENYRNIIIQYVFPRFASIKADYVFQLDGAPANYSSRMRTYLDSNRPVSWIGKGGQ